jgi:hypothetical protein
LNTAFALAGWAREFGKRHRSLNGWAQASGDRDCYLARAEEYLLLLITVAGPAAIDVGHKVISDRVLEQNFRTSPDNSEA